MIAEKAKTAVRCSVAGVVTRQNHNNNNKSKEKQTQHHAYLQVKINILPTYPYT